MSQSTKSKTNLIRDEWPVVAFVWIIGLGVTGYQTARISFDALPHPVHWTAGLAGAGLGYLTGWAWYRWRGDII